MSRTIFRYWTFLHSRSCGFAVECVRSYGIDIVSREMAAFEWLHQAGTAVFREISQQFLR